MFSGKRSVRCGPVVSLVWVWVVVCVLVLATSIAGAEPRDCPAGDWDGDCDTDLLDFAAMQVCFGKSAAGELWGDGIIDDSDASCVSTRHGCSVGVGDPYCDAADLNCDGVVDEQDDTVIDECYLQTAEDCPYCEPEAPPCPRCPDVNNDCHVMDLDTDGDIDLADYARMAATFSGPGDCPRCPDLIDDGLIDLSDFMFVESKVGCAVGTGDPECDAADLDCDGAVTDDDTDIVQDCFFMIPEDCPYC
ncbi:MAG: hypothetical protein KAV82_08055 [Phycisphaerae bacterium]|nr:hypothetical protein [Phycisphaerae bacterium]